MNKPRTDAWWCPDCEERYELEPNGDRRRRRTCPKCESEARMHRCSRYEWFLIDTLDAALDIARLSYQIRPQFPIHDHRGFDWFWDLGVWVDGESYHGGAGLLIDVNGPEHLVQKTYSGPGGGYTRDYDKTWELGSQKRHKRGWDHWIVRNDECRYADRSVYVTADMITTHLRYMSNNFL